MLRIQSLFLLCFLGAACVSQPRENIDPRAEASPEVEMISAPTPAVEAGAPVPSVQPQAWTDAFQHGAILVGDTIRVEGPPGLIVHAALSVNDEYFILEQRTTEQGFLQVLVPKPMVGSDSKRVAGPELRCQLDRWTLAAGQRIEVLERIVPCDVVLVAEGNATWRDLNNNVQRKERLEFRGAQPKE